MDIFIPAIMVFGIVMDGTIIVALLSQRNRIASSSKYLIIALITSILWSAYILSLHLIKDINTLNLIEYLSGGITTLFIAFLTYFVAHLIYQGLVPSIIRGFIFIPLLIHVFFIYLLPDYAKLEIGVSNKGLNDISVSTGTEIGIFESIFVVYIVSAVIFTFTIRKGTAGRLRTQVNIIIAGIIVTAVVGVLFNLIVPTLFKGVFDHYWIGPTATLFFSYTTGYTIIRHQLYDIRPIFSKYIAYGSLLGLMTISVISLFALMSEFNIVTTNSSRSVQIASYLMVGAIFAVTFGQLRKVFVRISNKLFYSDAFDQEATTQELIYLSQTASSPTEVSDQSADIIDDAMNLTGTKVLITPNKKTGDMVTIVQGSKQLGVLLPGERNSKNLFSKQDMRFLKTAADEIAAGLISAQRFEEINRLNVNLESKVEDATKELKKANTELSVLNKSKDDFISMASHQLKSPLSATRQSLELLKDSSNSKTTNEVVAIATESTKRTQQLVEEMLDITKIRLGELQLNKQKTNVSTLLTKRVAIARKAAETKGVSITLEASIGLHANLDPHYMREVVANLLENAIKYSPDSSNITVSAKKVKETIVISVTDQGIGVPKADQAKIFDKFYRAANAKRHERDGTGLGLYLAKQVVELHNGQLSVKSNNKGSTFTVSLPTK